MSWRVQVPFSAEATDSTWPALRFGSAFPSLPTAFANLQAGLDSSVGRALEVGPLEPIPVPQQVLPVTAGAEAIELCLDRLADLFPDAEK